MSVPKNRFIGINDNRLLHVREVGRVCAELAEHLFGWSDAKTQEMFLMGFVHDFGYEYSEEQHLHAGIGGQILERTGFKYAREVSDHGSPAIPAMSEELLILNIADMSVNGSGQRVTFEQRLSDIRERYGAESSQYLDAADLVSAIEKELKKLGKDPDISSLVI